MQFIKSHKIRTAVLALAAMAGLAAPTASEAALTLNLRFADGSTSKNVSEVADGTAFTIDVWATVTGTGAGAEGINALYLGAQTQIVNPYVDGDVTARSLNFTGSGNSLGTLQSLSHAATGGLDDQIDLGGANLSSTSGFARPTAGAGTYVTDGGQAVDNGMEFKVATLTYTIHDIGAFESTMDETTAVRLNPILPSSALATLRATWMQDGVQVNAGTAGTGGYVLGSGVDFTVGGVPEPASLGLIGLGAVALLTRRRRQA